MPKYYRDLIPWLITYIGGSTAACGTVSTEVEVPALANCADIHAEGAALYYTINGAAASSSSYGVIPQDKSWIVGPLDNLGTLHVIGGGTAAVAHVEFYQG